MIVIVDKNNPRVADAFHQFGEIRALSTAEITKDAVRDAEMLIIRSETKITKELLNGSAVRFVGSATIGTDHVDIDYLTSTSRKFVSAPGSNANSVAEYIVAALLTLSQKKSFSLRGKSIGVVGIGNVGSKVVRYASALGMTVLQNDPPLARETGKTDFLPLDSLMECDFITIHVPLTKTGDDPTLHLFSQERISRMKQGSILLNTSRGPVVDGNALKQALETHQLSGAVLDVWENEPVIDIELLNKVDIGTPHIAGYSYDGKVTAVKMLYDEACRYFGQPISWTPDVADINIQYRIVASENDGSSIEHRIHQIVRRWYEIDQDDRRLRKITMFPELGRKIYFRQLRAEYSVRQEFCNGEVRGPAEDIKEILTQIGYKVR